MNFSSVRAYIGSIPQGRVPLALGVSAFVAGALFLLAVYLGILTIAQSWEHAVQQLEQDAIWVALAALGFGAQLGLFGYQRALLHDAFGGGTATAATAAGTGTSTLGMVACCAHHVTDIAPLIGLAGFGGVASILAEWKMPFIWIGLAVNLAGIALSLRILRRMRAQS